MSFGAIYPLLYLLTVQSSEFKEAFPAGRFRPICKIQAKRGASTSVVAESIKAPEWWHSTRIIQAFDAVLQDKVIISPKTSQTRTDDSNSH